MKTNLKQLVTAALLFGGMLAGTASYAQNVPQKFNYQGVARDAKGNPIGKQTLGLKISVLAAEGAAEAEYEEVQTVTTNEYGLYTLQIGAGTATKGEMKMVAWETGNKYIKVAIDPKGGTNYTDLGTTQLLSVPYAIYADRAGSAKNGGGSDRAGTVSTSAAGTGTVNFLTKFTGANTIYNSQVFDNGTNIGIGTTSPNAKVQITNTTTTPTELRINHTNATGGASRLSFKNDNEAGFSATSNFAILNKYASGTAGTAAPGYPFSNLFGFNNSRGNLLFSTKGSIGFGFYDITATPQVTVRMHIDSALGNVGIGTSAPTAKLDVLGGAWDLSTSDGDLKIGDNTNKFRLGIATGGGGAGHTTMSSTGMLSLGTGSTYPNLRTLNVGGGNVGIGTITPTQKLHVVNPSGWAYAQIDGISEQGIILGDGTNNRFALTSGFYGADDFSIFAYGYGSVLNAKASGRVGIGTIAPTAKLHVIDNDTAGLFQADNALSTGTINGIVRAEYTGSATINDHVAVSGKVTNTTAGWGIGVRGEGNFMGVRGIGDDYGVYGSSVNNYGLYGSGATGVYGSGTFRGGEFTSYNLNSYGSYSYGDSIGSFNTGRFIGSYGLAENTNTGSATAYSIGAYNVGKSANYRSYGSLNQANGTASGWNQYGTYSEAKGSGGTNFGIYATAYNGTSNYAGYFDGTLYATTGTFGTKPFTIDHPLDPENKYLRHSSIESNDMMNIYNGNITTDANGYATVTMPDYFEALNENFKYQLTVIGTFAQAIIKEEVANNKFVIQTNQPNVKVSWQVTGVRHDAVAKKYPVVVEEEKSNKDKGKYMEPEAFGKSKEMGIHYVEPSENPSENAISPREQAKQQHEAMLKKQKEHDEVNSKVVKPSPNVVTPAKGLEPGNRK